MVDYWSSRKKEYIRSNTNKVYVFDSHGILSADLKLSGNKQLDIEGSLWYLRTQVFLCSYVLILGVKNPQV